VDDELETCNPSIFGGSFWPSRGHCLSAVQGVRLLSSLDEI
jgi:hypothetical protein